MNTRYSVRYVHAVSAAPSDVGGRVELPSSAFADSKTLGAALRRAGVLAPGSSVREYRTEANRVVVFPRKAPGQWHSIILTDDIGSVYTALWADPIYCRMHATKDRNGARWTAACARAPGAVAPAEERRFLAAIRRLQRYEKAAFERANVKAW